MEQTIPAQNSMNKPLLPQLSKSRSNFLQVVYILLFTSLIPSITHASEKLLGKWYLDHDLVAKATLDQGIISLRLTNTGDNIRTINAALADERYLLANILRLRIKSDITPRGRIEMFRLSGDGVIGNTSDFYRITPLEVKAGGSLEITIPVHEAIDRLAESNEVVARWKRSGYRLFCITLAINFRDIGIASDAGMELKSPWIVLDQPKDRPTAGVSP